MAFLWIAVLGALGTVCRYFFVSLAFVGSEFPIATLLINTSGSFAMGLLSGYSKPGAFAVLALGVGFLGGFTTFSAYALESSRLLLAGKYSVGLTYAVVSPLFCVLSAAAGLWVADCAGRVLLR